MHVRGVVLGAGGGFFVRLVFFRTRGSDVRAGGHVFRGDVLGPGGGRVTSRRRVAGFVQPGRYRPGRLRHA